jgi:hypothetical protein
LLHAHNSLQSRNGIVPNKVALDKTPSRGRQMLLGTGIMRRQLGIMQRTHRKRDKQQRELLRMHSARRLAPGSIVHAVKEGLDKDARRNVVAVCVRFFRFSRFSHSARLKTQTHFQA